MITRFELVSDGSEPSMLVLYTIPLCAMRESNSRLNLGRITCYHYTNNAIGVFIIYCEDAPRNSTVSPTGSRTPSFGFKDRICFTHYIIGLCAIRESNSHLILGRDSFCHYTNSAKGHWVVNLRSGISFLRATLPILLYTISYAVWRIRTSAMFPLPQLSKLVPYHSVNTANG